MATSKPGYGAIPPVIPRGQILTANGMNGSSWMSPPVPQHAIQIGNPDPVITFNMDGNITTKTGTITAEDWVTTIKIMKRLIMDMSTDQELASKYPYIQDAAHSWLMEELKK
jgi:hypothetical protein